MPSMVPMMSAMRLLAWLISSMVVTTWPTTSPPRWATLAAEPASWLAWAAASALWRTVLVSCSMALAVCCRLPAVCSVRWLRSALPAAISALAVRIESLDWRTWAMVRASDSDITRNAVINSPNSSLRRVAGTALRSPWAMRPASSTASCSGVRMLRTSSTVPNSMPAMMAATVIAATTTVLRRSAATLARDTSAAFSWISTNSCRALT